MEEKNKEREKAVDILIKTCIEQKNIGFALQAAKLGASKEGIDFLVWALIDKGCVSDAKETAKIGGRSLTKKEIDYMMNGCLQRGWLPSAIATAKLKGKELTTEEIKQLIEGMKREYQRWHT